MARRKGKAVRGKSRVSQVPMGPTEQELRATFEALEAMGFGATDRCPLCVALGVDLEPSGDARTTVRHAVGPVPPSTG